MAIEKVNNAPVAPAAANKDAEVAKVNGRKVSRLEKGLKIALIAGAVAVGLAALAALVASAVVYLFPALAISGTIAGGVAAAGAAIGTGISSLAGLVTLYPLYTAIAGAVGLAVLGLGGGAYALYKYVSKKDEDSASVKAAEQAPEEAKAEEKKEEDKPADAAAEPAAPAPAGAPVVTAEDLKAKREEIGLPPTTPAPAAAEEKAPEAPVAAPEAAKPAEAAPAPAEKVA